MGAKVRDFGGTVLRVLGDEVLAVFGAPVAHEDDAERAVRAALDDLRRALALAQPTGDPAMRLRAARALLEGEPDEAAANAARDAARQIVAALPDDETRRRFESSGPVLAAG